MLTEAAKLKIEGETKEAQIQWCKDLIQVSARYERLMVSKDFTDMLHDLENLKKVHEDEVKGWTEQLEGMSYFKSMRLLEVIKVNQIRANQIREALNYIPKLIDSANEARELLKSMREESSNATRN